MPQNKPSFPNDYPNIMLDWADDNLVDPNDLSYGSRKIIHWICHKCGYSWSTTLKNRTISKRGCAVCSGKRIMPGYNDVLTLHPEIEQFFDISNNFSLSNMASTSRKKAQWKCKKGHVFTRCIETMIKSQECPICEGSKCGVLVEGMNDLSTLHPKIASYWDYSKNDKLPSQVTAGSSYLAWWKCPETGKSYQRDIYDQVHRTHESPYTVSSTQEKEVCDFVVSLIGEDDVILHNRTIISPYEIDIYVPSKNFAIEFNGIYWHSDARGKSKNYHKNKFEKCKDMGIQLFTIWEDDWSDKKNIIKSMLIHKLGVDKSERIYARKCSIEHIDYETSKQFLNDYHIQGSSRGTFHTGLIYEDSLVAVSSWIKRGDTLYLDRYATSCTVIGGMGKLLKHGLKYAQKNGCTHIITFSDNEVSDGRLYKILGFSMDAYLPPDYKYLYKGKRKHKFGFRKSRFKKDKNLYYDKNLTEFELAKINSIPRCFDCGKIRWRLKVH